MKKIANRFTALVFTFLLSQIFCELAAQTNTFTAGVCIGGTGCDVRFYSPLTGNFDGSAGLDIIVVNECNNVRLFKNNGSNGFDAGTDIISGVFGAMSAGDLDGDGDLDLVHVNGKAYLNNGTGTFTQYGAGPIFTAPGGVGATKIADFNGDGKQDIVFINYSPNSGDNNQVWLNTGTMGNPVFALSDIWDNTAVGWRGSVTVGDIDADGDLDIITGNSGWSGGVYKNNGSGDFSQHQIINSYNGKIFLIDWDGDNDLDYLIGDSYNYYGVRLRKNDGAGTFETTETILLNSVQALGVEIADLNADGAYDLIVPAYAGARYYLNTGCAFTLSGQTLSNSNNGVPLADFNNDGKLDIFCSARDVASCLWFNDLNAGSSPSFNFTNSGNWNSPTNWDCNTTIPPATIPSGWVVNINATSNLNINQTLATGSSMNVPATRTLQLENGFALTNNGTLTITGTFINNGTLKGTGTLVQNGTFTNNANGVIAPGASPDKLTVTGDLNLGSGTYQCEINGTGQGTSYDWLAVSGQATLTNAKLVVDWGSYTPSAGQIFEVMTFGSRVGTFSTVTIPPVSGINFTTSYTNDKVTINAALLPVELVNFEAKPEDGNILLSWRTASEINNHGFEVQHSTEGINWQPLGFVEGNGTALEPHDYEFTHLHPATRNYYRLRQMDFDGGEEFSKIVFVFMGNGNDQPRIFPTVTDGVVMFENNGEVAEQIFVFNASGQLVMTARQAAQVDLSEWQPGLYLVQARSASGTVTERVVKR